MKNVFYKWFIDIDVRVIDLEYFFFMSIEVKMVEVKVCMSYGCVCQGSKQYGFSWYLNSILNYNYKIDIFLEIKSFYILVNLDFVLICILLMDCLNFVKL